MNGLYTYVATALIAASLAATGAWKVQDWRYDSMDKERIEAAREIEHLRAHTADTASATHETFKEKERVVYQTITETVDRIVDRPVYSNVCLDADGLRALNAAIHGAEPTASQPAPTVP